MPAEPKTLKHSTVINGYIKTAEEIKRGVHEVLLESELKAALIRLNPEITRSESLAEEVIYTLRAVFLCVNQVGLVKSNEEFFKWLTGEKSMPFGESNRHVPVRLIDFEDHTNNTYVATNQYRFITAKQRFRISCC